MAEHKWGRTGSGMQDYLGVARAWGLIQPHRRRPQFVGLATSSDRNWHAKKLT